MNEETATLIAQVDIGDQAKRFFESDLGRFLTGRSMQDTEEAVAELKYANPQDGDKIAELQMRIQVSEAALKWLAAAIVEGEQAEDQIHEREALTNG